MDNKKIILIVLSVLGLLGIIFAIYWFFVPNKNANVVKILPIEMGSNNQNISSDPCIISVRGGKYDVTEFRNMHKGGNIFRCGEDMTETFNNQHGDKQFKELQKYKVEE